MDGSTERDPHRSSPRSYADRLQTHLAEYKVNSVWGLDVDAEGECRHKAYPHILPAKQRDLNILPTIRQDFWAYWKKLEARPPEDGKPPRLHTCFPHLNSSQALAFNLFYPFIRHEFADGDLLLSVLRSDTTISGTDRIEKIVLEYEPDRREGSNFDVAIFCASRLILVEVKLTESEFGTCANDKKHREKLVDIYEELLREKVSEECLYGPTFFKNYQVLRHFARLKGEGVEVVFLFPKANEPLWRTGEDFIRQKLTAPYNQQVRIVYLEDFVSSILTASKDRPSLNDHFELVDRKYRPDSA